MPDVSSLSVELDEVRFDESALYFIEMIMDGGASADSVQERTDISTVLSNTPAFSQRVFSFDVPAGSSIDQWSLQLNAIAIVPKAEVVPGGKNTRVAGSSTLALDDVVGPLLQTPDLEVSRLVEFISPDDDPLGGSRPSGTLNLKLRYEQASRPPSSKAGSAAGQPGVSAEEAAAVKLQAVTRGHLHRQESYRQEQARAEQERARYNAPPPGLRLQTRRQTPSPPPAAAVDRSADAAIITQLRGELSHQQALVERLMDDVDKRSAAVSRAGEEVMELRGVNKQMEAELSSLRA